MNFPTSPTNGQTATVNNIVYTYNSANTTWTRTPGIIPDISTGNISATGFVSAAGNVTGAYIFGNGSQLTGLPAGYANSNAVAYGEAGWAGNIIPSANATYSLGTAANQWKSLYLSNSTLYLANVAINMGSGNVLQVAGSNVVTAGANNAISTAGNVTGGNILTGGVVSATGNVTGNYIFGNGSLLSGIITSVSNINNGTSNITVVSSGGNATVSIGGTSNVAVFATTGEYVTGVISASGNITGGNVISGGVRVYKWTTQANTAPTGAVPGDSWYDSYASKLYLYINDGTGNQWVDQSFPTTFANLSVTGNIQGGNVTTTGLVSATGNINANFFVGNGSALTGLSASKIYNGTSEANIGTSGGNANISIGGTSNVVVVATTGVYVTGLTSVTGNITAGNISTGGTMNITGASQAASYSASGNVTAAGHVGTIYTNSIINTGSNATGNIGSTALYFNTVFAKATSAQYADLAEKYLADAEYAPGTVVSFGGAREVTLSQTANDPRIAGVVSSYPAHVMNAGLQDELAVTVALTGRVPTSVVGGVLKGDMMVSAGNGFAQACATPAMGTVIGKSLENFHGESGVIEIVVGKL